MKLVTIIFTIIAVLLIGFNATQLNFDALFEGKSIVALITIVACLCVIVLLQVFRVSKKIERKNNKISK